MQFFYLIFFSDLQNHVFSMISMSNFSFTRFLSYEFLKVILQFIGAKAHCDVANMFKK
jgi:hypothetical protein